MLKGIVNGVEKEITRIPMYGYNPATSTGTNSISFTANETRVISCSIEGNLAQSTVPSTSIPVYPQECGERTENLFDYKAFFAGKVSTGQNDAYKYALKPNTQYTISCNVPVDVTSQSSIGFYARVFLSKQNAGPGTTDNGCWAGHTRTIWSNNDGSIYILMRGPNVQPPATEVTLAEWEANGYWLMFVEGAYTEETMPSYVPYGYSIPLTLNNQTNPLYLSEPIRKISTYADSASSGNTATRKIKKLVLTGEENWARDINSGTFFTDSCTDYLCTSGVTCMCSHYVGVENAAGATSALEGISFITNPEYYRLYIKDPNFNSLEAFVTFLKGQYNTNTPVTIWYILADATTETISFPSLSCQKGQNTLTIDTTLSPSSTSITYIGTQGEYKEGWEVRDNQDRLIWGYNSTISGVSSVSFKGGGTALTDYSITGNMVQSGTPSPTNPIYPSETGDRTGNLFDAAFFTANAKKQNCTAAVSAGSIVITSTGSDCYIGETQNVGEVVYQSARSCAVRVKPSTTYTFASRTPKCYVMIADLNWNVVYQKNFTVTTEMTSYQIDVPSDGVYMIFRLGNQSISVGESYTFDNVMLNEGSTALPYEPYGYSIPITCGNTYPIYLSEPIRKIGDYADVAGLSIGGANRKIKKMVLTGEEDVKSSTVSNTYQINVSTSMDSSVTVICSHFQSVESVPSYNMREGKVLHANGVDDTNICFGAINQFRTPSDFKQWISDQYTAGTPVTVWYILATPTTESTTIPQIQAARGSNTLTVGTTLPPSSVSITGHVR